jgi:hypothetical protein
MAMLNNQRVTKKKASPQTLQKVDVDKSCAGPQRVFSSNNIGWQVNVSSLAWKRPYVGVVYLGYEMSKQHTCLRVHGCTICTVPKKIK